VPNGKVSTRRSSDRIAFGVRRETALQYTYLLYDFVALSLFLCTLYVLLGKWYRPRSALIAGLFCGGLASVAFRDHSFQPWSMIEAWFFCAALLALALAYVEPLLEEPAEARR